MPVNQFLRRERERRTLTVTIFRSFIMGSSDRGRDNAPGGTQREPAPAGSPTGSPTGGADAYANWLDRMQRARARQAAITRNLYTWTNYKNWADQVRDSWSNTDNNNAPPSGGKPKK
jgi:hypothetical protein